MIRPSRLRLKNVVYFKDVDVRLDANPITFVRGLNLDSDPTNPTSNGVGKSLLFGTLPNALYFSPPLALKKKAKKELLGKGSEICINLSNGDDKYQLSQLPTKYKIVRNKEDLGIRTVPLAEKFIRDTLFPISETVYYTTCYVSTQRRFRMQEDSDADRMALFTDLFSLDEYDHIKRYFLNKLSEVRDSELKLQVLERELLEVNAKLKKLKRATREDASTISDMRSKRESIEKKIAANVDVEFRSKALLNDLNTLLTVERELDALRSSYTSKQSPNEYVRYLKSQRKLVREHDTYLELLTSYKRTVKDTQRKLDALKLPKQSQTELESKLESCERAAEKLQVKLRDLKAERKAHAQLVETRDDLYSELKDLGYSRKKKPDLKANYGDQIAECKTTLKLKRLLDHTHDNDAKCPTCLSDVDVDNVRKAIKSAEKRLPELEAAKAAQRTYADWVEADKAVSDSTFNESELGEIEARLERSGPAIEKLKAEIKIWERHDTYTRSLRSVKKPDSPEQKPDTDLTVDQLDDTIELCEDIIKHLSARNKLIENNDQLTGLRTVKSVQKRIEQEKAELESVKGVLSDLRSKLSEVVKALDEANSAQHEHEVYSTQRKKLTKKIDGLRPFIEHKRLLEVLVKAYSPKGLKTLAANNICGLLEQNLNAYSNLIFTEPFVFTVQAKDSGLSMIVDRGNDKISDVRNLSGAESNAFRLLFVMSLLPLLPDDKRISMLTLDEPCAHMDEVFRTKFLRMFLPALSEIVPHIFIITPNPDDYCEGSVQWIVQKHRGKSTVIVDNVVEANHDVGSVLKTAKSKSRRKKK